MQNQSNLLGTFDIQLKRALIKIIIIVITNHAHKKSKTIKASLFFIFQSFLLENQDESRHVHNINVVNIKEGEAVQFMKTGLPNSVTVKLELVDPAVKPSFVSFKTCKGLRSSLSEQISTVHCASIAVTAQSGFLYHQLTQLANMKFGIF